MISIGIHNPERATLHTYTHDGRLCGSVTIHCGKMDATIYGTPEGCRAIADAINGDAEQKPAQEPALTHDTFANWRALKPKWRWIARDQNGHVWAYTAQPIIRHDCWATKGDGIAIRISNMFAGHTVGTCDWKNSLIERPAE